MKLNKELNYKDMYISWLKENIEQYQINDTTYRITTPFLDKNNDYTEFYITNKGNDEFLITDNGNTMDELLFSGIEIFSSENRKNIFNKIIRSQGIDYNEETKELYITCSIEEIPIKKHLLIQCMQKVSDLFILSRPNIQSLFIEDVEKYLISNNITYLENMSFIGKSKLYTTYDFVIGKNPQKNLPARMIKVVNNLDPNYARNIMFSWEDIKQEREDSKLYTFIKDGDKSPSQNILTALTEYDITPILWSKRNKYISELAA